MTQIAEQKESHLSNFASLAKLDSVRQSGPGWIETLRQRGIKRFDEVGFPTTKDEAWRYTNVAPITRTAFKLAEADGEGAAAEALARFTFGRMVGVEVVFVNGRFSQKLSRIGKLPAGVTVSSLAEALQKGEGTLEQHLGRHAAVEANPFIALNTGFVRDGAFVRLARNTHMAQPIHLIFISTPTAEPGVCHPRVLLVAEEDVQATVVETYVGSGPGVYLTNSVTEIVAGRNAQIDHCRLQQESLEAFHVSATHVNMAEGADFVSHNAALGSRLCRNDLEVVLDGERAHATLNGLVIAGGEQHVDNHTVLRHEKANCPSHELYKHVLDGKATGVFKGKIFVQKDAQKTDSKQTSKSLLLSDDAVMNSMPALEIYADDVKCTHGSTTGPVDEEMVFYLRSRGVSLEAARHLLTYAFAADITRRIRVAPFRARLEDFMAAQHGLPQDLRITDLGSHTEAAL